MEEYWDNGQLEYRFHVTTDGKRHGLYEVYNSDGSIAYLGYYDMGNLIKLDNDYYSNRIQIRYFI